jgi:hypothetical protein
MEILFFDRVRPTDEMIPAGNPPGWGAPAEAGDDLAVEKGHIFEVSSYDLAVAEIVVVMDEAVIEGFERGVTDEFEFQGGPGWRVFLREGFPLFLGGGWSSFVWHCWHPIGLGGVE